MDLNFKLQKLILLLIIPALGIQILLQGWLINYEMKRTIIEGIDDVLFVVSDTLSAFLYGDGHEELLTPKSIRALAAHKNPNRAWGIDDISTNLVDINLATGEAVRINFPELPNLISISASKSESLLYGLDQNRRTLYEIDISTAQVKSLGMLPVHTSGLLYNPTTQELYGFDLSLFMIDTVSLSVKDQFHFSTPVPEALVLNPAKQELIALSQDKKQLHFLDEAGVLKHTRMLTPATEVQAPVIFNALLMGAESKNFYAAGDILTRVDLSLGHYESNGMSSQFYSSEGPFYKRGRGPMVRIKNELGLTYLYTQYMVSDAQIMYGIDATDFQNENFTPPGYMETISKKDSEKLSKIVHHGNTYISDVQYWKNWGYLKTCYAPIFNHEGTIVAMTGSDVSADTVDTETRKATYWSIFIGLNCILIAGGISCLISFRMTKPIDAMKENALLLAAGNYKKRLPTQSIKELNVLGDQFNQLAGVIESEVGNMQNFYKRLSFHTISQYLNKFLHERSLRQPHSGSHRLSVSFNQQESASLLPAYGWVETEHRLFYWSYRHTKTMPHDARVNLQIKTLIKKLLSDANCSWQQLNDQMSVFAQEHPSLSYIDINLEHVSVHTHLASSFHFYQLNSDQELSEIKAGGERHPLHASGFCFADNGQALDASMIQNKSPKGPCRLVTINLQSLNG